MKTLIRTALLLACASTVAMAADPPEAINYQGVLRDASGKPVPADTYAMTFRFFDDLDPAPPEDEILVDHHDAVQVTDGLFNVALGSGVVSDGSGSGRYGSLARAFGDFPNVHLQVEVGIETLTPRIPIHAAAYALNARHVRGREIISDGPLDLYVDAASGHDGNNCLTGVTACRTIQEAVNRIPAVLGGDVTVHIADGDYQESVLLADRSTPEGFSLTLLGNTSTPSEVTITGAGLTEAGTGISVWGIRNVRLLGLHVEHFASGVFLEDVRAEISDCEISDHTGHGIVAMQSVLWVEGTIITYCGIQGLFCHGSWVVLGDGISISHSGDQGIKAEGACGVHFEGGGEITNNTGVGLSAADSGLINLRDRSDVIITGNNGGGCQMRARRHGTIQGYQNTSVDCCDDPPTYGLCDPEWR